MYFSSPVDTPLSSGEFYLLLVLAINEGHAYNLRERIVVLSQGAVKMGNGTFNPLLQRMHEHGYVDLSGHKPAGKSGALRRHYGLSEYGKIRLKEELHRMRQAVRTAENIGLLEDELPLDIQKLILDSHISGR